MQAEDQSHALCSFSGLYIRHARRHGWKWGWRRRASAGPPRRIAADVRPQQSGRRKLEPQLTPARKYRGNPERLLGRFWAIFEQTPVAMKRIPLRLKTSYQMGRGTDWGGLDTRAKCVRETGSKW